MFALQSTKYHNNQLKVFIKWLLLAILIGIGVGVLSTLFMQILLAVTHYREGSGFIIYFLPLAGLFIGLVYQYWGEGLALGNRLIMEKSIKYSGLLPLKMIPLVFITSIISHLFGGSTGREGAAVQMGGVWAHQLLRPFSLSTSHSPLLVITGVSAGFGAMFGTPFAGFIFALEVFTPTRFLKLSLMPCLVAAYVGFFVAKVIGLPYSNYNIGYRYDGDWKIFGSILIFGILCGLIARLFVGLNIKVAQLGNKLIKYAPLRPLLGGILIVIIVQIIGSTEYLGLGETLIEKSFHHDVSPFAFFWKIILTTLTLALGFKGGEVTPLIFIGATFGNLFAHYFPVPQSLIVALGFVTVFSAAARAPLAGAFLIVELFGYKYGFLGLLTCILAYSVAGPKSLYNLKPESTADYPFWRLLKKEFHLDRFPIFNISIPDYFKRTFIQKKK